MKLPKLPQELLRVLEKHAEAIEWSKRVSSRGGYVTSTERALVDIDAAIRAEVER